MEIDHLVNFKNLQISKKELTDKLGENLFAVKINEPIIIYASDVINLLNAYKSGKIKNEVLIDWVNVVWFTELFSYNDTHCDSIASVLNELEELDESGKDLTEGDINLYINALKNNLEF